MIITISFRNRYFFPYFLVCQHFSVWIITSTYQQFITCSNLTIKILICWLWPRLTTKTLLTTSIEIVPLSLLLTLNIFNTVFSSLNYCCSFYMRASNHCVKSVFIPSYSDPHFPAFALNTERYPVFLRIQSEFGKMRTRITPNTYTYYYAVNCSL